MKSGDMLMTSIDETVIYLQFFAATSFMISITIIQNKIAYG